ncbi:sterol carrier protein domain-containing protein [Rhizobium sp. LjRoot30]|uniref:sterol carrier protein domain-containing protein n=1 Tax=Rhizobium sp. LjRoot30 TaxID=3342320 RepID=UPI003F504163
MQAQELAKLIFGADQPSTLAASGRIQTTDADGAEELDRIIATSRRPYSSLSF